LSYMSSPAPATRHLREKLIPLALLAGLAALGIIDVQQRKGRAAEWAVLRIDANSVSTNPQDYRETDRPPYLREPIVVFRNDSDNTWIRDSQIEGALSRRIARTPKEAGTVILITPSPAGLRFYEPDGEATEGGHAASQVVAYGNHYDLDLVDMQSRTAIILHKRIQFIYPRRLLVPGGRDGHGNLLPVQHLNPVEDTASYLRSLTSK
jgi:hypothetical protein